MIFYFIFFPPWYPGSPRELTATPPPIPRRTPGFRDGVEEGKWQREANKSHTPSDRHHLGERIMRQKFLRARELAIQATSLSVVLILFDLAAIFIHPSIHSSTHSSDKCSLSDVTSCTVLYVGAPGRKMSQPQPEELTVQ